jgi:omega-6 fatty acid desaturase (delta-12 desaturase)
MRSGKELILASKEYSSEDRAKSWFETIITLVLLVIFFSVTILPIPLFFRLVGSFGCALLYVRMFVIYHDYQHNAILQNSAIATLLMQAFGIYILAPQNIWKRSHDHHHNHNSKLTITGIGSYPTICKKRYLQLSKKQQQMYLINRHPLTVLFGYFTLFIYWLNVKSFIESPKKHFDSLFALFFHIGVGTTIYYYLGGLTFFVSWFIPFLIAFGMGSYLFYCQHNFPDAQFRENQDWAYDNAALTSSSFMVMNPILQWLTGNIGYHHVHHLNSRIPFYRLPEAMAGIPELQRAATTSWNPMEMIRCFKLKLWDAERGKMITLKQMTN